MNLDTRNNTNYTISVSNELKRIVNANKTPIRPHQIALLNYLVYSKSKDVRGVLAVHSTGTGKSLIAAGFGEMYRKENPTCKVVVVAARTLRVGYTSAVEQYYKFTGTDVPEDWEASYRFITLGASNMADQLAQREHTKEQKILSKKIGLDLSNIDLENTALIIDEAHNIFNMITNGSQNGLSLYNAVMRAKNIRILFLTATPIINHPFELVPCFNMIAGKPILPDVWDDFNNSFIDGINVKNKDKFQDRIVGLVSYYERGDSDDYPEEKPVKEEIIEMSAYQYRLYSYAREIERQEASKTFGTRPVSLVKPKTASSSYRVRSRQLSIFTPPPYAVNRTGKRDVPVYSAINTDDFKNIDEYSPKFAAVYKNILTNLKKPGIGLVYSSFVEAGVGLFARYLQFKGWTDNIKEKKDNIFTLITGNLSFEERSDIIKSVTEKTTPVKLVLISGTGAEGVDFKNITHLHVMEPQWNYARFLQVRGRASRYKSHIDLPATARFVQPYIYISVAPKSISVSEDSTEQELYTNAKQRFECIQNFNHAMRDVAVDCILHKQDDNYECRVCAPTNSRLFTDDLTADILEPSRCLSVESSTISVNTIQIDDDTYYWTRESGQLEVYKSDSDGNIIQLSPGTSIYVKIARQV